MTNAGVGQPALRAPERQSPGVSDPAPTRLIGLALVVGLLLDVGLRGGVANAVVAAGVLLVVVALVSDRRLQRAEARLLAVAAAIPAAFLAVRASPWLAASNVVAIGALVAAAVSHARSGSVLDTTPRRVIGRTGSAVVHGLSGLVLLGKIAPPIRSSTADRLVRVLRAAVVAVPILAVVVVLLASADAVFASLLVPDVNPGPLLGHAVLTAYLGAAALCTGVAASSDPHDRTRTGASVTWR